jgi:ABC-type transport system involved in cytochrome bd biosynthesis fused ATPase/permease subunit
VEIRVDAWKLCQLMRRAEPRSAEDIGTWQSILEFISTAAIIVNSGLVAFTATNMEDSTWALRSWTFLLMTAGLMAMRTIVAMLIPDMPEWVGIQLKRQEYINGKVLDNIEDEDDSALLHKTGYQVPNFLIDGTDIDPM